MEHVVHGCKSTNTVKLGPVQTEAFHQILPDGYVMTDDGYVFPVEMSVPEMERRKKCMILTGSVYTKHVSSLSQNESYWCILLGFLGWVELFRKNF
jgi:hypothetical protein